MSVEVRTVIVPKDSTYLREGVGMMFTLHEDDRRLWKTLTGARAVHLVSRDNWALDPFRTLEPLAEHPQDPKIKDILDGAIVHNLTRRHVRSVFKFKRGWEKRWFVLVLS